MKEKKNNLYFYKEFKNSVRTMKNKTENYFT